MYSNAYLSRKWLRATTACAFSHSFCLIEFNLILDPPLRTWLEHLLLLVSHLLPAVLPCRLASLDGSVMAKTCPASPAGERSHISPQKVDEI